MEAIAEPSTSPPRTPRVAMKAITSGRSMRAMMLRRSGAATGCGAGGGSGTTSSEGEDMTER